MSETLFRKSNYALITALYVNKSSGFYSDIYFPIIKYSLAMLYSSKKEGNAFFQAEDVRDFIIKRFGIRIPAIVIGKSIKIIGTRNSSEMDVQVYEKGNSFNIRCAYFDKDVEEQEKHFNEAIKNIDIEYQNYIEDRGLHNDNVTFLQFITDNTDDILDSFHNANDTEECENREERIDGKYATLVFFLQHLNSHNKDMYQVANQLFWSSIIAAFLKEGKPQVAETMNGRYVEYYLDTSIVMGMLNLSTPEKENYSQELVDIIKASRGALYVNNMTVEEIDRILMSVESNGIPNPFSDIYSAWKRGNFTIPNDLTDLRLHMYDRLKTLGIKIQPIMSPEEIKNAEKALCGKKIVRDLYDYRKGSESYSKDNYREIHDIYMDEYISKERKAKPHNNIYFLTSNIDLIKFCESMHNGTSNMVSARQVVLDLWMHNANKSDIPGCLLTASIARCLDMHKAQVVRNIQEVSKYYNQTKDNFNPDVYEEYIKKLYERTKCVIDFAEAKHDKIEDAEAWGRLIQEAINADNAEANAKLAAHQEDKRILDEQLSIEKGANREKAEKIYDLKTQIQRKDEELATQKAIHANTISQKDEELKRERANTNIANERIELYKQKEQEERILEDLKTQFNEWSIEREKSFHNYWGWGALTTTIILGLAIVGLPIGNKLHFYAISLLPWLTILTALFGSFMGCYFFFCNNKDNRKQKAYERWEKKKENSRYTYLKNEIESHEVNLNEIKMRLQSYDSAQKV